MSADQSEEEVEVEEGENSRWRETYFDVSACGERGENKQESQTQNHHVESPSVCHGSAQRLILHLSAPRRTPLHRLQLGGRSRGNKVRPDLLQTLINPFKKAAAPIKWLSELLVPLLRSAVV